MSPKAKEKKAVAMIGYGSQGRALALNLRDSGYNVLIGLRAKSKSRTIARKDGFKSLHTIPDAVANADIICFAFPDHLHGKVFTDHIAPHLRPGATLLFLHGLSVHFGFVKPPTNCDVILLAPHAPGIAVRERYLSDRSISAFYALHQNRSRKAASTAFAIAAAVGFQKKRLIRTTFEDEALGDIFGEQAVLCGGLSMLIKNGFEVLVENGLKPENAYLEVAFQLDLIISLIKRYGIEGMLERISLAARFGSITNGPRIIDDHVKRQMSRVYNDIKKGRFTRQLAALSETDIKALDKQAAKLTNQKIEKNAKKFSR
jgi:ketol-acid reductoisomerase